MLILNSHHRIDSFGRVAPCYDAVLDLITFGMYTRFLRRAVKILAPRKGERILDQGMVEWAKKRYGGLKKVMFLHKNVTKSWEYQNYFDDIFTSFAIHELPEKKRLAAFEHSYLALKEKGRMVIADFNPQISGCGKTFLLVFFKLFERENLNFFSFDQNEILKKTGFKRVRTFPVLGSLFRITLAHKS